VDPTTRGNRIAWESASRKHVDEYREHLEQAISGEYLFATERLLLRDILREGPLVVHLQSGHGMEDVALVQAGARSVLGVDFSTVAAGAAQRRASEIGVACRYVVAVVPEVPVASASADLVYTGKGALIWLQDLAAWADEVARVLRPGGQLFVYEAHPAVPLWTWDTDERSGGREISRRARGRGGCRTRTRCSRDAAERCR
jgi:SAM-dependent methyltransferase